MAGFGSSVFLGDLDSDFIAPSQACVNPIFADSSATTSASSSTSASASASASASSSAASSGRALISIASGAFSGIQVGQDGVPRANLIKTTPTKTATVSLNDCLACSGCVTSAETVLITSQSTNAVREALASGNFDHTVVTISQQACASFGAHFGLGLRDAFAKFSAFARQNFRAEAVLDTSMGRDAALLESAAEFIARAKVQGLHTSRSGVDWTSPGFTVAVSSSQSRDALTGFLMTEEGAGGKPGPLPVLTSSCPGWVCYAEKTHPEALPYLSSCKSPQQIMGRFVKSFVSREMEAAPSRVLHITVMPCFDKKLEASRLDFFDDRTNSHDVDIVLTPGEIVDMLNSSGTQFAALSSSFAGAEASALRNLETKVNANMLSLPSVQNQGSGGYLEYVFRRAGEELFGIRMDHELPLTYVQGPNIDIQYTELKNENGVVLMRFARAYGFRNIQTIVRKMRQGRCNFDYVEIMACPSGCTNGGGLVKPAARSDRRSARLRTEELFHKERSYAQPSFALHTEWLRSAQPYSPTTIAAMHTRFHAIVPMEKAAPQRIKW